jgi:hypothetical protein
MTDQMDQDEPEVDDAGVEDNEPEVDETGVERDNDEQVERAPQPGNTPAPGAPPFDSPLPRERDEQ